jgi:adenylate kinase family enzyme
MKNLIFINGTMGIGKTTVSKKLLKVLPNCVFLDGDWCWDADPFIVNDETKRMVLNNICYLLNSFLTCSAYENIIFCWVMHEESIMNTVLSMLQSKDYNLYRFSLISSESALVSRLQKDIDSGIRADEIIKRALSRLHNYLEMNTIKIDVSDYAPEKIAHIISDHVYAAK